MTPEEATQHFRDNPKRLVRIKSGGILYFCHKLSDGRYKTVCSTTYNHRNKRIKEMLFKIKVYLYKLTHDTGYVIPDDYMKIITNRKIK